jgi:hypothetical protein
MWYFKFKLPGSIWIFIRAEWRGLDEFAGGLAVDMISRFLPDCNVTNFLDLLPAEAFGNCLDGLLLCIQVLPGPLPSLGVLLPVDWWS